MGDQDELINQVELGVAPAWLELKPAATLAIFVDKIEDTCFRGTSGQKRHAGENGKQSNNICICIYRERESVVP